MKGYASVLLLLILARCAPNSSQAAPVTVCDQASLRSAASGGGTVTFGCSGTIVLTSPIVVSNDLVLDGTGQWVTLSGGTNTQLFRVNAGVQFTLINLTLIDGDAVQGGAIFNDGGSLLLRGVVCAGHQAVNRAFPPLSPGEGGAIYSQTGIVTAVDCLFSNCVASGFRSPAYPPSSTARGGAIAARLGRLDFTQCIFLENRAIGTDGVPQPSMASVGGDGVGGAVFSDGEMVVVRTIFARNAAWGGRGGSTGPSLGTSPPGQAAEGGSALGGAIYAQGVLSVQSCLLSSNSLAAGEGGTGGNAVNEGPFMGLGDPGGGGGTGGPARGGAIYTAGSFLLTDSALIGNYALAGTGGRGGNGGSVAGLGGPGGVGGSAFGGAIFCTNTNSIETPSVYITNCTIGLNAAIAGNGTNGGNAGISSLAVGAPGGNGGFGGAGGNSSGGGIYKAGTPNGPLIHSTIASNQTVAGTGGLGGTNTCGRTGCGTNGSAGLSGRTSGSNLASDNSSPEGLTVANSIFANATGIANVDGSMSDLGHNISSDNSSVFSHGTSLRNTDPKLRSLAHNSWRTTFPLSPDSPALNAADPAFCPVADQRGVPRPRGAGCDIGAFEASFLSVRHLADGSLAFEYVGVPGSVYTLLSSTPPGLWNNAGTAKANSNGRVNFPRFSAVDINSQLFFIVSGP